jgi:3-hydroxybutyryl-CoA dehydrogenase
MDIRTVGVVGCGQMGGGIAQVAAAAGYSVLVMDASPELLEKGLGRIRAQLDRDVEKGRLAADQRDATLSRIQGVTALDSFAPCDLVIEAIVENMAEKKRLFAALDKVVQPGAILASNTSSLSLTEIGTATSRPDRVAGAHFFNPVPVMPLLEIVRTISTSDDTVDALKAVGARLGKTTVVAKDTPGFIVSALLIPYLLDAIRSLEHGVATRDDIDIAMKLGCNLPMGPLTLSDFIGNDTVFYIAEAMYAEFRDPRYAPPPLLRRMVLSGLHGRKSGRGFYDY